MPAMACPTAPAAISGDGGLRRSGDTRIGASRTVGERMALSAGLLAELDAKGDAEGLVA